MRKLLTWKIYRNSVITGLTENTVGAVYFDTHMRTVFRKFTDNIFYI